MAVSWCALIHYTRVIVGAVRFQSVPAAARIGRLDHKIEDPFKEACMTRMAAYRRGGRGLVLGLAVLGPALVVGQGGSEPARGDRSVVRRARPPQWDGEQTAGIFFEDAFRDGLVGDRPALTAAPGDPDVPVLATPSNRRAGAPPTGSPNWPQVISAETIEDEVKAIRIQLDQALTTPQQFAGGGYLVARRQFSMLALLFAIVRDYEGDVRWRNDAPAAVGMFAHAASVCQIGSAQVYRTAKARRADLEDLVGGEKLRPPAARPASGWPDLPNRAPLMQRLEQAMEKGFADWGSNRSSFSAHKSKVKHDAEIVAAIAEFLTQDGMEDGDDDEYAAYCRQMKQSAQAIIESARRGHYDRAGEAVGQMRKSCTDCHDLYRG
jgi:hypothetical protein